MNHLPSPRGPLPLAKDNGVPVEEWVDYYRRRAEGEVGLILSGGTCVESTFAHSATWCTRWETTEQLKAWERIVRAVHDAGGAFAPQLWHMGYAADSPVGPSALPAQAEADGRSARPPARAMDKRDMQEAIWAFCAAARKAREIGCDAIEIHGAHGFLIDSFINAEQNKRSDEYGGPIENRLRFPAELVSSVRTTVGPEFPILFRFNNRFPDVPEAAAFAAGLARAGVTVLHLSSCDVLKPGFPQTGATTAAGAFRKLSGLLVAGVGGVTRCLSAKDRKGAELHRFLDPTPAIELVECGEIDLLAVGTALLGNPDWVLRVRTGAWETLKPYAFT